MKRLSVYYEVVMDKFFVRFVRSNVNEFNDTDEAIFNWCDEMVDYYRDNYPTYDKINFFMINHSK